MEKKCPPKKKPPLKYSSPIWGTLKSPGVMLIWLRWQTLKADTWTNARVVEMCRLLNLTLEEVCAMAGVFSRTEINKYWQSNRWPLPVGIHFTQHLSAYFAMKHPDIKQKFFSDD